MILLIDNYDSFTYNLFQLVSGLRSGVCVVRNDAFTLEELDRWEISALLLSPGPGRPMDAGQTMAVIRHCAGRIPILGVCLGMQAIAEVFGGRVVATGEVTHGKMSKVRHSGGGLFQGLPKELEVGRYHSLQVDRETLPSELRIDATTESGCIMAISHCYLPCYGVQFHPESVLTRQGGRLLERFFTIADAACAQERPVELMPRQERVMECM